MLWSPGTRTFTWVDALAKRSFLGSPPFLDRRGRHATTPYADSTPGTPHSSGGPSSVRRADGGGGGRRAGRPRARCSPRAASPDPRALGASDLPRGVEQVGEHAGVPVLDLRGGRQCSLDDLDVNRRLRRDVAEGHDGVACEEDVGGLVPVHASGRTRSSRRSPTRPSGMPQRAAVVRSPAGRPAFELGELLQELARLATASVRGGDVDRDEQISAAAASEVRHAPRRSRRVVPDSVPSSSAIARPRRASISSSAPSAAWTIGTSSVANRSWPCARTRRARRPRA